MLVLYLVEDCGCPDPCDVSADHVGDAGRASQEEEKNKVQHGRGLVVVLHHGFVAVMDLHDNSCTVYADHTVSSGERNDGCAVKYVTVLPVDTRCLTRRRMHLVASKGTAILPNHQPNKPATPIEECDETEVQRYPQKADSEKLGIFL